MDANNEHEPQQYLVKASAAWVVGFEHPGGKRDCEETKTAKMHHLFLAFSVEEARGRAKEFLSEFKNSLPGKRAGGLSWQNEDAKITSVTFAMILDLNAE